MEPTFPSKQRFWLISRFGICFDSSFVIYYLNRRLRHLCLLRSFAFKAAKSHGTFHAAAARKSKPRFGVVIHFTKPLDLFCLSQDAEFCTQCACKQLIYRLKLTVTVQDTSGVEVELVLFEVCVLLLSFNVDDK